MSGVPGSPTFFARIGLAIVGFFSNPWVQGAVTAATLVVGVKGFQDTKNMLAKGQDIMAQKTSAGGKLPVIYGNRRVGSQVIYMDTAGNESTHLNVVYALSVGEVEEIILDTIEIDGNPLDDPNQFRNGGYLGSDKISSGAGSLCTANQNTGSVDLQAGTFGTNPALSGYRFVFNAHHGAASQAADPMLVASSGGKWTTAHKLNGIAYLSCSFIYDSKAQFKGVPRITVQVKGKKVFDPRDSNQTFSNKSTYKFSDNPALTFLDFCCDNQYGKGLPISQINLPTFTAAANLADVQVDQPYFNGSTKPITWSGVAGDDFLTLADDTAWWQGKVGELLSIYDANGNQILDAEEIRAARRNRFFGDNVTYYKWFIGSTLGSTFSPQSGTYLVKTKRFTCNGYVSGDKTVMENAKELLSNMRGIFLYVDGKYELSIEDTGSSTFSITDNHIISDQGISVDYGNKDKRANKVIVEFYNANKKYELDTATVLHTASVSGEDFTFDDGGEVLEVKAEFPYCTDPYTAFNMAKAILVRSRNQTTMRFLGTPEMYKMNVNDIVTLTYAGLGFNGKVCRVEALELQANGLVAVNLIEYFDVYTWEVPPQEALEPLENTPSAYAVKAPTNLAFTDTDASNNGRPFLSWALPTDYPYHQWRINVKDSSNNQQINKIVDVNNCDLTFLPVGTNYVASITSLNSLGVESNATVLTFTVGDAPTRTPDIKDGAITNVKVLNLSAAKINTGELNLGTAVGMAIKQGKSGYTDNSTTGLWLGNDGGTTKLNIGSSSKYLRFDGTNLLVAGDISASTGTISTSIAIGTGNNIFKADTNGIYLGNASYGSATFKVSPSGIVQSTKRITSGAGATQATLSGDDDTYRFWSGGTTGSTADFSVSKTGELVAKKISIYNDDGGLIFSSQGGFTDLALTEISATTGTPVATVSGTFSANGDSSASWQSITLVATTNLSISVKLNTSFGGSSSSNTNIGQATSAATAKIPVNFTLQMQYSANGGSSWNNIALTAGGSGNSQQFTRTTSSPSAQQYKVDLVTESEPGFFVAFADVAKGTGSTNSGSVDSAGFTTITGTISNLAGATAGTTYKFRTLVTTSATGYDTNNKVTATAPRTLTITDTSGSGFYVDGGDGSQTVPSGDITSVTAGTNLNGGGTSGAVTLNLDSTISGNHVFSGEVKSNALELPVQTPSSTTNKIYNVGGALYFNGAAVGGGGDGDIEAVVAGTNLTGGGTSGSVTLNLANAISISGTIGSGAITSSGTITSADFFKATGANIKFSAGGTHVFNVDVNRNIYPSTHASTDLGFSSSLAFRQLYLSSFAEVGSLRIGTTVVIDDSRNLTNIGTIGSGAITASTSLTVNTDANSSLTIKDGGTNAIQMVAAAGDELYIGGNNSYAIRFLNSSNDVVLDNGSKLGIGTASPAYKLHQSGTGLQRFLIDATDNNANGSGMYLRVLNSGSVVSQSTITIDNAGNLKFFTGTSSEAERLRVLNNGDIGFGTSSPTSYGGANFEFSKTSTSQVGVRVTSSNSSGEIGVDTNGTYIQSATANKGIRFYTNNGSVLAGGFISNGAFQIGTTTVIDASRNITNVISVNSANGFLGNASGTTPGSCKLHLGAINSSGSSAIAQFGGFTRTVTPMIVHESAGSSNAVAVAYTSGDVDLYSNNEGAGANKSVRINALKIQTTTVIDGSRNLTNIGTIASGAITSSGNVTAFSDERLKTNIQTLDPKLALKMRGVSFTKDEKQGSGVIAQEIEKIAPELVLTADDEIGTKSVAYGNLVGYLIETVKDQQKQIDELKELIGAA